MKLGHFAYLDPDRQARSVIPEAVLAEGKRDDHLAECVRGMVRSAGWALVTRLAPERSRLATDGPWEATYHEEARLAVCRTPDAPREAFDGRVLVLAAGTTDVGVAEEARLTAHELGAGTHHAYDVGVAGPHRLDDALDGLPWSPDVCIVAAGREAALATVVAARMTCPVVGLPVSAGYGLGGQGEAAILGMLQACAPLAVVNIDAGFVAGAVAARIAHGVAAARSSSPDPEETIHAR